MRTSASIRAWFRLSAALLLGLLSACGSSLEPAASPVKSSGTDPTTSARSTFDATDPRMAALADDLLCPVLQSSE